MMLAAFVCAISAVLAYSIARFPIPDTKSR